jgi:hypothetical protein
MKLNCGLINITVVLFSFASFLIAQNPDLMSVTENLSNETIIDVHPDIHKDYGLTFPLTYKFDYNTLLKNLRVFKKYQSGDEWTEIEQKSTEDFSMVLKLPELILLWVLPMSLLDLVN